MARRRENILKVALEEFSRNGFANTSLDHIAELCRVSKTTIYRQIGSKADLFLAALERVGAELANENQAIAASSGSYVDLIERLVRFSHHRSKQADFGIIRWAICESASFPSFSSRLRDNIMMINRPLIDVIFKLEHGKITREQAEWRALILMNMAVGGFLRLIGSDLPDHPQWPVEVLDIFLGR